jgi:hypothetical protein
MYTFVLKNINQSLIDNEFGLYKEKKISNINSLFEPVNETVISNHTRTKIKCVISHIDLNKHGYNCFWCRYSIPNDVYPVSCPVRYLNGSLIKTYISADNKQTFFMSENISKNDLDVLSEETLPKKMGIDNDPYYVTEGVFCSFNCCVAYINDNKHNPVYDNSYKLLLKMYKTIMGKEVDVIKPAHNWRILTSYGGTQTIAEFRDTLSKIEFVAQDYTLLYKPIMFLYEKKFSF